MTKKMMEDLLDTIIKLSDEIIEIQANSSHLRDLIIDTEMKINRVNFNLLGLQQNIFNIDQKFMMVIDLWRTREDKIITKKAV